MLEEGVNEILLKGNLRVTFILVHGYTSAPTDFNGLGDALNKEFDATIKIHLLKGHGTEVKDLTGIRYRDFLRQIESELVDEIESGNKVIIGGYSFGAQIALYLAAKYNVAGAFSVAIPYKLRFPFNVPGLWLLGLFKRYWKKRLSESEMELRNGKAFYYDHMHKNGMKLILKGNKCLKRSLPKITCPWINIQSKDEKIAHAATSEKIMKKINSSVSETMILDLGDHNPFYSMKREDISDRIIDFFHRNVFLDKKNKK